MTQPVTATVETQITLVDRYFHTRTERECGCQLVEMQGKVVCQVDTNTYLVQLYEWFVGEPLHQVLLTLEDFMSRNTVFYDDAEWMKFAYDHERGVRVTCEHQRGLL